MSLGNRRFGKADGSLEVGPCKSLLRRHHLDFSHVGSFAAGSMIGFNTIIYS